MALTLNNASPIASHVFSQLLGLPFLSRLVMDGARWNPVTSGNGMEYQLLGPPKLSFLQLNSGRKFRSAHLHWFLPFTSSLTHLDLRGNPKLDDVGVSTDVSCFTELKYLRLTRCFALTDVSLGSGLATKLTKMESLDISDTKASDHTIALWLHNCPGLVTLIFARSCATNACLPIIGRMGLQHLRHLSMEGHPRITDSFVDYLSSLSNLTTLNFGGCSGLSGQSVISTISLMTSLRNLSLNRFLMDDYEFTYISRLTNLETLSASNCSNLDGTGLERVSTQLFHLRSLNLSACDLISDQLSHLTPLSRTLQELNLAGCGLNDDCMPYLGELTKLSSLDISRSHISNIGITYLQTLTRLQALSISHLSHLTDSGLLSITKLTTLTQLDASWNYEISEASLSSIIKMGLLKRIDVSYCPSVSTPFLDHLVFHSGLDMYFPLTET